MSAAQVLEPDPLPADKSNDPVLLAAAECERWDVLHRPSNKGSFPARIEARRNELKQLEAQLAQLPASAAQSSIPFHAELIDLRAIPRLLRAAVSAVSDRVSLVARLPRVVTAQKEEPRVATIAETY